MSAGLTKVAGGLLIPESSLDIPTDDGVALRASGGQLQQATKGGAWQSVGSGVGWDAQMWRQIQALLGSQVDDYITSHLLNPNEYDITAGTAPGAQLQTTAGGVIRESGGAGTSFVQFAGMKQAGPVIIPVPSQKTSAWACAVRFRLPNAPSGASYFVDIVNASASGAGSATVLRVNTNISLTVLQLIQDQSPDAGGTTTTACNAVGTIGSGIAVGTFYDALLVWDANNQLLTAQINGVTCATSAVATNQPTQNLASLNINTNKANAIDVDAMLLAFKRAA